MSDEQQDDAPEGLRLDVCEWCKRKGTEAWAFAGAARGQRWSIGEWVEHTRCTEAEYDNAVHAAKYGR